MRLLSSRTFPIDRSYTDQPDLSQAQHVVSSLWKGEWVQQNNDDSDIDYVRYEAKPNPEASFGTKFAAHFNPQRLGVPRYQNICSFCSPFSSLFELLD